MLAEPLPGQLDAVAAAATVLLKFGTHAEALAARTAVGHVDLGAVPRDSSRDVTIEVVYDGEDLAEVGMLTGLGRDGVVAAHTGQLWTAAFGGFAPGFTYLLGENHTLDVPRRSSPRTAVPAGSVALGGTFSAVYPRQSPGGWQLIGRTTAVLWDLGRESPALVRPGDTVRYVAVREAVALTPDRLRHRTRPAKSPDPRWWWTHPDCNRWSRTSAAPDWEIWEFQPRAPWTSNRRVRPTAWWATNPVRRLWKRCWADFRSGRSVTR